MSDYSQGPDWWLASDGKWYPPTSLPAAAAPVAQQQQPQSQPIVPPPNRTSGLSTTLSRWVEVLFWVNAGVLAIVGTLALFTINAFEKFADQQSSFSNLETWDNFEAALFAFRFLFYVVEIPLFVLLIVWTYQGYKASKLLHPVDRYWVSGWTIGAWFIPIASLIMPKLVLDETEKIARAPRSGGIVVSNWKQCAKPSGIGWIWWISFVIMSIALYAAVLVYPSNTIALSEGRINSSYMLLGFASLIGTLSAVFGVLYVRLIGNHLSFHGLMTHTSDVSEGNRPIGLA